MNNTKQISINVKAAARRTVGCRRRTRTKTPADGLLVAVVPARSRSFTALTALVYAPVNVAFAFLPLRAEGVDVDPGWIFFAGVAVLIRSIPRINR
jgi:hypothetical protein